MKGSTPMLRFSSWSAALLLLFLALAATTASAAQRAMVSTMKNVRAVTESRGYFIAPHYESAGQIIPGDEAPTQAFEIIRPSDSRMTVGRLFTSCSCVQLESPKATFERGERAVLTLRNVKATPASGQTYALYVQLTSPVRTTLRYDTFVQSDRFVISEPVEVASVEVVNHETVDPTAEAAEVAPERITTEAVLSKLPDTEETILDAASGIEVDLAETEIQSAIPSDDDIQFFGDKSEIIRQILSISAPVAKNIQFFLVRRECFA